MPEITKSEFEEWQNHFITKAFMLVIQERIEGAKDVLAGSAGINQQEDNFYRGFIHAHREVLDFRVDNSDEEN